MYVAMNEELELTIVEIEQANEISYLLRTKVADLINKLLKLQGIPKLNLDVTDKEKVIFEFNGKFHEIQEHLKKVDEEVPAKLDVLLEAKKGLDAKKKELIKEIKDQKEERDKLLKVKKDIREFES